jgi:hypothetical protein
LTCQVAKGCLSGMRPLSNPGLGVGRRLMRASVTSTDARNRVFDASVCRTDARKIAGVEPGSFLVGRPSALLASVPKELDGPSCDHDSSGAQYARGKRLFHRVSIFEYFRVHIQPPFFGAPVPIQRIDEPSERGEIHGVLGHQRGAMNTAYQGPVRIFSPVNMTRRQSAYRPARQPIAGVGHLSACPLVRERPTSHE